jgi:hypothetical protein
MEDIIKEGRQIRVTVPAKYRKWKVEANKQNKALGFRAFSLQRVVQAVLDYMEENGFEKILENLKSESLEDTRCGPGRGHKKD